MLGHSWLPALWCSNFTWTAKGLSCTYTCIQSTPSPAPTQAPHLLLLVFNLTASVVKRLRSGLCWTRSLAGFMASVAYVPLVGGLWLWLLAVVLHAAVWPGWLITFSRTSVFSLSVFPFRKEACWTHPVWLYLLTLLCVCRQNVNVDCNRALLSSLKFVVG